MPKKRRDKRSSSSFDQSSPSPYPCNSKNADKNKAKTQSLRVDDEKEWREQPYVEPMEMDPTRRQLDWEKLARQTGKDLCSALETRDEFEYQEDELGGSMLVGNFELPNTYVVDVELESTSGNGRRRSSRKTSIRQRSPIVSVLTDFHFRSRLLRDDCLGEAVGGLSLM